MRKELIKWAGGEHDFALSVPDLLALQDRCNGDGVGLIYSRLQAGIFGVNDVLAPIALGLERGGMDKRDATTLTRTVFEDNGLNALALTAHAILSVSLNGWPDQEGEAGVETP